MNPKLEIRKTEINGKGVFAREKLKKDEVICIFGGHIKTLIEEEKMPKQLQDEGLQISAEFALGAIKKSQIEDASMFNHSCDPNAGFKGQIFLVAMKNIKKGEQVTFDYAMVLSKAKNACFYKMKCLCGSDNCRGYVTENDWKKPELQKKYDGYFQWYLQDKINNLKQQKFEKNEEFLSAIPEWEKDYKQSEEMQIKFEKKDWKSAKAIFTKDDLKIFGYSVMEAWETPYMKELAAIAARGGGIILEVGYGMGISASFIQDHEIEKHIIIEANSDVVKEAIKFQQKAKYKVEILSGFWEEVIEQIPDSSIDGILFDTYPLTEEEIYQTQFYFFETAFRKLKKGGILTYYASEEKNFGKVHIEKLKKAGFNMTNIKKKIIKVNPPDDCEYWKSKTILCPIIIK